RPHPPPSHPSFPTRRSSDLIVAWVGRALNSAYNYYVKLEDRIDPQERVLKAMGSAAVFTIHFIRKGNGGSIGAEFHGVLRRQRLDRKSTRLNSSHVSISYAV